MSDVNPPQQPDANEPTAVIPPTEPTAVIPPPEPTAPLPPYQPPYQPPLTAPDAGPDAGWVAPGAPAYLPPPAPRRGRRTALITVVAVIVAAILGGGAFAVYKVFFSGGPQPDEVLPASTIAILTIDLNPSAGQKIAAIKAIRKFPALKKTLGLQTQDDLRKFVFEKAIENSGCSDLSYDKVVKPWIGKRAAIAAVDLGGKNPVPAIALQISDQAKAKKDFAAIEKCADFGSDFGFVVGKDYLIASDSTAHAQKILDEGKAHPLSDDPTYKRWTKEAGDQGVVNFYVAKKASDYLAKAVDSLAQSFTDGLGGSSSGSAYSSSSDYGSYSGSSAPRATDCNGDPFTSLKGQLKDFQGLAGTIRFANGGMELSVATGGVNQIASTATVGDKISQLPSDTAIALGFGVPKDYASTLVDSFKCGAGGSGDDAITQAEQETGLQLPEDLQTLLGSALTLSVGGNAPSSLSDISDPSEVPVGLLIHGDATKIKDLISKIQDAVGYSLDDAQIGVKTSGDRLVLSPSEDYANALLGDGSLGNSSNFKDAVPNADRAAGIFYVDFDSKWRETLIKFAADQGASDHDVQVAEDNSKPLKALGISSWNQGGISHILIKLTTN